MTEKLSPEDFDSLVAQSRMKDDAVAMARAVMVDGRGYEEVAQEFGRVRQNVYQAVARLTKILSEAPEVYDYTGTAEAFAAIDAIVDAHEGRKMLTEKQFDNAAAASSLAESSLALAKGVLVDGEDNIVLAKRHGVARHLVWQAVTRLMKRVDVSTERTRRYRGSKAMFDAIESAIAANTGAAAKKKAGV
jgi:hypothetical protein